MVKRGKVVGNTIAASVMAFMVAVLVVACGGGGGNGNGLMGILTAYSVGGTVGGLNSTGLVLQNNGGDNLSITANGAFTFASAIAPGATYNVTVLTQPTSVPTLAQRCNVANGSGTMGNTNVTNVAVNCFSPRYAFTANSSNNTVSSYVVDAATGRLTYIGTVGAGTNPQSVTVDPSGTHAYVANYGSNNVSQYAIAADGSLSLIGTVAAGAEPQSVTIDPTGKYAYVANYGYGSHSSSTVSQYTIGANGALTPMTTPFVFADAGPLSVTVSSNGLYAYVANVTSNDVSQYTIGTGGALTAMSPNATVPAAGLPKSVTVDPSGKYAYVANWGGTICCTNGVSQYTIGANGALTPMTTPFIAAGTSPTSLTVDPSGKYTYVTNSGDNTVSQYTIGTSGALTAMGTPTVATGTTPQSVTVDPSGYYAYVTNVGNNTISQYTIGTNGSLTPFTAPYTTVTATVPVSLAMSAGAPVGPASKYVYVASFASTTNQLSQFTIGAGGTLAAMTPSAVSTETGPIGIAVDPAFKYAYVPNHSSNTISQYTIGGTGGLTPMSSPTVSTSPGTYPNSVTVDSTGTHAYVLLNNASLTIGNIARYDISPTNGGLSYASSAVTGVTPLSVAIDPSRTHAYVVNNGDNTVSQYTIDANGNLTAMSPASAPAGTAPRWITLDPSGTHAYVANGGSNTISQYNIVSGALSPMSPASAVAAGAYPLTVTIAPNGKYAYVSNFSGGTISQYTIGTGGALSPMAASAVGGLSSPSGIAVDLTGKYAYVTDYVLNTISQFNIGITGGLTFAASAPVGAQPMYPITAGIIPRQ